MATTATPAIKGERPQDLDDVFEEEDLEVPTWQLPLYLTD
jgi:hypothetical protein